MPRSAPTRSAHCSRRIRAAAWSSSPATPRPCERSIRRSAAIREWWRSSARVCGRHPGDGAATRCCVRSARGRGRTRPTTRARSGWCSRPTPWPRASRCRAWDSCCTRTSHGHRPGSSNGSGAWSAWAVARVKSSRRGSRHHERPARSCGSARDSRVRRASGGARCARAMPAGRSSASWSNGCARMRGTAAGARTAAQRRWQRTSTDSSRSRSIAEKLDSCAAFTMASAGA